MCHTERVLGNASVCGGLTSCVRGLGVFGFVEVTVDGTDPIAAVVCELEACFNVFCGFNAILKEFSFRRPFVPNCMDNEF